MWYKRFGRAKQISNILLLIRGNIVYFQRVDTLLTTYVEVVSVYLSCHLFCNIEESMKLNYEEWANFHSFRRLRIPKELKLTSQSFTSKIARPKSFPPLPLTRGLLTAAFQGGKTFCASFCASLIAGSRRAFLCVDCVCLLLAF